MIVIRCSECDRELLMTEVDGDTYHVEPCPDCGDARYEDGLAVGVACEDCHEGYGNGYQLGYDAGFDDGLDAGKDLP